jgi:hypothetical protein
MKFTRNVEVTPIGPNGRCLPPDPNLSYTQEVERQDKEGVTIIKSIVDSREEVPNRGK